MKKTRRQLLKVAAASASALAIPALARPGVVGTGSTPGANEQIRLGFIATGHRARLLMDQIPEGAEVVAFSDCNLRQRELALEEKEKETFPNDPEANQKLDNPRRKGYELPDPP